MTQDNDKHDRSLGLTPAQVLGSALAAMSGAFLASWLGTAGTLVGAAVGSVVATIGAAIYTHSLRRTAEAVKRTAAQARHSALLTGAVPQPESHRASEAPVRDPNAPRPGDPDPAAPVEPGDSVDAPGAGVPLSQRLDLPWIKVAFASLVVLIAALGGITAVELITGKPLSSLLGGDAGSGTTVQHVVGNQHSNKDTTPPKKTPDSPAPSSKPSEQPQQPVPSTTPEPTPLPSTTPAPQVDPSDLPAPDDTTP
jgi:hypothetical protein